MTAAAAPPVVADAGIDRTTQLRASAQLIGALAVIGAVLGLIWEAWSPPGPAGAVLEHGIQADETEAFIAGDGRFALITVIVGLIAGVAAWLLRPMRVARGPYVAAALAVGGVIGAALTELVGYLVRGSGRTYSCTSGTGRCIDHLPLTVHMHALLLTEAIAAVLVYSLCVAFAVADDLGRPDAARPAAAEPLVAPDSPVPPESGGTEADPQQAWRYGDGPGAP